MLFKRKYFYILSNGKFLQESTIDKKMFSYAELNIGKASWPMIKITQAFLTVSKLNNAPVEYELLRLKAHLIDLLELSQSILNKRNVMYKEAKENFICDLDPLKTKLFHDFLESDRKCLEGRADYVFNKYLNLISNTNQILKLEEIKSEMNSNLYLLSYKVKRPYYF